MDYNVEAQRSLHAIDAWTDIIESNINGGQRVAYKAKKPTFTLGSKIMNGGIAPTKPWNADPDTYIPQASLEIAEVRPDMTQGEIYGSTEDSHLAIQGTGWFICTNTTDFSGKGTTMTAYYTRDGQFEWDSQGYLRTYNGLYVCNASFPPYQPERNTIAANIAAGTDSAVNYFMNKTRVATAGPPPVKAADLDQNGDLDPTHVGLARFPQEAGLEYSNYGTDFLVEGQASGRPLYFNTGDPHVDTIVKTKSLEATNGSMTEYIPTLAAAQKMFSAVSKIIAVYNSTTDDMNSLIR